jgi:tetratricopeptide (TPR) repeat protein
MASIGVLFLKFINQVKHVLGIRSVSIVSNKPEFATLREALDAGQRAKRAENYPAALAELGRAMHLAISVGDTTAIAVIALNQAEVYTETGRYDDARELLESTYQGAQSARQRTQVAYMLDGLGWLAQRQDRWDEAQKYYEEALEMARSTRASGAEGRALGLLADTYLRANNASYAIHLLRESLPRLNLTGDIELSSYFVGRLGQALIASGQANEGQQLLVRALRLARQMGYRRYERLWGGVLGARALEQGRSEEALQYFTDALALYDALPADTSQIQALCQITKAALTLREHDTALGHAQRAEGRSTELGESPHAQAQAALGIVLVARRAFADALPYLESATERYRRLQINDGVFTESDLARALAAAYAETGADENAIRIYRDAAERAQAAGQRLETAQAHRDLGLHLLARHRMADAVREWTQAVSIYEAERQLSQAARLYCDIAAARRYLGQGSRALKDYEQALMLLSSLKDDWETRGLVLANAATAYVDQGDLESADSFFNESIAIARRLGDSAAEATRRGNYGWFLLVTGKPQQAQSTIDYALRMSIDLRLDLQVAVQTDNLGLVADAMGDLAAGAGYHQRALHLLSKQGRTFWRARVRINYGNCLVLLEDAPLARQQFEQSLTEARADEDVEAIISALTGLGRAALLQPAAGDALTRLDEAVQLARKADMRRLLADALSVSSAAHAALGNGELAVNLWSEALKFYTILNAPQRLQQPSWLNAGTTM